MNACERLCVDGFVVSWLSLRLAQTNEMCTCVFSLPFSKANDVCLYWHMCVCARKWNWAAVLLGCVQAVSLNDKVYWWLRLNHYLLCFLFIPLQPPRSLQMTCYIDRSRLFNSAALKLWHSLNRVPAFSACLHCPYAHIYTIGCSSR